MTTETARERFRAVVLIGEPYVRRAVRDGIAARFGRAFAPKRCVDLGDNRSVDVLKGDGTLFIDVGHWDDASAMSRAAALAALGVEAAILAFAPSYRGLAHDLILLRRAGIRYVTGLVRAGTRTPAAADDKAVEQAQQAFGTYLAFAGWEPEQVPLIRVTLGQPRELMEVALAAAADARRRIAPLRLTGRVCFACAHCGVQVCGAVSKITRGELERDWTLVQNADEALVPPGGYLRGDGGKTMFGSFELRVGTLYFHEADWLDPTDNGNGMAVTCCGARPEPPKGFNLSCSNGHLLGELWTDCCSPQGVHVPAENLVLRDAIASD